MLSGPGRLAQLGERLVYTQEVGGSIPSPPTRIIRAWIGLGLAAPDPTNSPPLRATHRSGATDGSSPVRRSLQPVAGAKVTLPAGARRGTWILPRRSPRPRSGLPSG